jgi:hypothetical protein
MFESKRPFGTPATNPKSFIFKLTIDYANQNRNGRSKDRPFVRSMIVGDEGLEPPTSRV